MKFKLNDPVIFNKTARGIIVDIKEKTSSWPEKTLLIKQSTGYKYWAYEYDTIIDEQKIRNDKINIILGEID